MNTKRSFLVFSKIGSKAVLRRSTGDLQRELLINVFNV
ncbi:Hypothetical protein CulFRC11_0655 [Corynebacterium ramonii]|uniref:Uncharacterized protein n=2 Tax=Corynebacterium TaxID=1716 RepID=A0ABN4EF45_9CORY|nr:Hypothetical protein Cul210932_0686 [Corynebacterium ulcerans]AIU32244.1 Hypothetical protein CulFRC11_0655 [Corynebacterium ramonii FRC0011]AKN76577.1 Hypothetical protein CulFRC58_0723 [Corynebacterium ulcerans FRC58]ESU58646.1 hypothetical protein D881_04335 [Corynebacterium ulcerans NCTC 12077]AIU91285.1 Hypothetical protein Cul05146_0704 [Corynebacterium ulcerans]